MAANITLNIYANDYTEMLGTLELTNHSDFPLALTWSTGDFTDITKRSGAFSKTFKVPASKLNNRILKYAYHVGINFYNHYGSCQAEVLCNGIPFFKGKLKINGVGQQSQPLEYDLELIGDNLDWVEYMKENTIRDIDYGNQLADYKPNELINHTKKVAATTKSHPFTEAYAIASWQNFPDKFNYLYGLKSYGAWKLGDTVTMEDMRPDVSIRHILYEAFRKAGYSLSSSFCSSAYFRRLVLAFTGNSFTKSANANDRLLFKSVLCTPRRFENLPKRHTSLLMRFNIPDCAGFFDNGNNYNGSVYRVPYRSNQNFILSGKISATTWYEHLNYFTIGIAKLQNGQIRPIEYQQVIFDGNNSQDISIETNFLELYPGEEIVVYYHYETGGWVINDRDPRFNISELEFYNQITGEILEGDTYEVSKVLPDIKLIDLLSSVMNMFNLYFRTDGITKTVYCEPRDQFLKPIDQAIDWSGKYDAGKEATIQYLDDYKRDLTFKYKLDTKDALVKQLAESTKKQPGSLACTLPEKYQPGNQDLGVKEFAYTLLFQDHQLVNVLFPAAAPPEVPRMWKELTPYPEASYDFTPRIMYYEGCVQKRLPNVNGQLTDTAWSFGKYKVARFAYPALTVATLDFGNVHGLVNNYYKNTISQIADGRQVIAYFNLNLSDILKLDLQIPIYLNHPTLKGYYYITTIADYRPAVGLPVKVTLLPAIATGSYTIDLSTQVDYGSNMRLAPTIGRGSGSATRFDGLVGENDLTPSTVLNNGTGNWAIAGSGSIAIGQGVIANARNQTVLGAYNVVSSSDIIQVGGGTSNQDRYRALTFTQDGNFLVQGGYLYTSDGREIMFASQRNEQGQPKRFDKLHLKGDGEASKFG